MDFGESSKLAVGIINKLDHCQRGVGNSETTVAQLERSIKTAKAGAVIKDVPPPRPVTQAPEVTAPATADTRTAGVNFSVRDLAALRKKKASEEASVGTATPPMSSRASADARAGATLSAPQNSTSGSNGGSSGIDPDQLPPNWVEKVDKKSGRLYYVNE